MTSLLNAEDVKQLKEQGCQCDLVNAGTTEEPEQWAVGITLEDCPVHGNPPANDIAWWFFSFADPHLPEGEQYLGGCFVKADSMENALTVSHLVGCNPGGEAQIIGPLRKIIPPEYTFKILTREEVESMEEPPDAD